MNKLQHSLSRVLKHPRLIASAVFSALLFAGLQTFLPATRALLLAFNTGALFFLVLMAALMVRATPQTMRHRAQVQQEGQWTVLLISLGVAGVVLGALSGELHAAKDKSIGDIVLASSSILMSWLFVAVMFSQQYAHSFYVKPDQLAFPGTEHPDYWDFMYFALVLSMCCQTSDVAVTASGMRRLVLLHSLVSFFFNVIIIAITVNVVAGVL